MSLLKTYIKIVYCIKCNNYRKFKNPKLYTYNEKLVLSIICNKYGNNNDRIFKEEKSIEILKKFLG